MTDPRHMNLTRTDVARSAADGAKVGLACAAGLILAAMLIAKPAEAVTIEQSRLIGEPVALSLGDFTALSAPSPRGSVTTSCGAPADGTRPIWKCASDAVPDGRYNGGELGEPWIDSADLASILWSPSFNRPIIALGFGTSDMADQGKPWGFSVAGASVTLDPRAEVPFGNDVWWTVNFDEPVTSAAITLSGAPADGWGIYGPTTAPIPLPASALLLLGGLAGLGWVKRRAHL